MTRAIRAALALAVALGLAACASQPRRPIPAHRPAPVRPKHPAPQSSQPQPRPPKPASPRTAVELGVSVGPPVSSLDLSPEGAQAAKDAFLSSCRVLVRRRDASGLTQPADWQPACAAAAVPGIDPVLFFRQQFETAIVGSGATYDTGYYEPEIEGSRTHDPGYETPVYRRPPDLVEIDAGLAAGGPASGKKQRGRMQDGQLVPYYERAEIDGGALANQGLEIAWAKDPVELFFLEIQGSGRLRLPDGSVMRIGYDGQNGRDYVGIGKWMRDQGLIGGDTGYATSMQGIMQWLRAHPDQAPGVMQQNKSYVFFRELIGPGPLGALGVPVVGHVSIAADGNFTPLGAPVWISADRPEVTGLWVAQDTGGAIRGANRYDTFWGAGVLARMTAGGMAARGQALVLLPRGVLGRVNGLRMASAPGTTPSPLPAVPGRPIPNAASAGAVARPAPNQAIAPIPARPIPAIAPTPTPASPAQAPFSVSSLPASPSSAPAAVRPSPPEAAQPAPLPLSTQTSPVPSVGPVPPSQPRVPPAPQLETDPAALAVTPAPAPDAAPAPRPQR